jgi:hypothetical protein
MTSPVDPGTGRGAAHLRLSRRSLIAAGSIVATIGSTSVARALTAYSKWPQKGLGDNGHPGNGHGHGHHGHGHGHHHHGDKPDPHCFCRGTRLLTPAGRVPIEDLSIGDVVVTQGGAERAIRWIGSISIQRNGAAWPERAIPIRIAKDAFAPGMPSRDLYLSRDHLLFLNGVLIPAGNLVNGTTIRAMAPAGDVLDYLHVELDGHDVVLAEGAPCESLLATAERRMGFDNYEEYVALYGVDADAGMVPCAPVAAFNGGRSELRSRLRSALAPIVDVRRPIDVVRDDLEARAVLLKAA